MTRWQRAGWMLVTLAGIALAALPDPQDEPVLEMEGPIDYEAAVAVLRRARVTDDVEIGWTTSTDLEGW